jgi:hypothetical protein
MEHLQRNLELLQHPVRNQPPEQVVPVRPCPAFQYASPSLAITNTMPLAHTYHACPALSLSSIARYGIQL